MKVSYDTWMLLIYHGLKQVSEIDVYEFEDEYPFTMWYEIDSEVQEVVDFILYDLTAFKDGEL